MRKKAQHLRETQLLLMTQADIDRATRQEERQATPPVEEQLDLLPRKPVLPTGYEDDEHDRIA